MVEDNYKLDMPTQPGTTKIILSDPQLPNSVTSQRTRLQKLEDTEKNNHSFMNSMKSIAARGASVRQTVESDRENKKKYKHQKTVDIDFDQFNVKLNPVSVQQKNLPASNMAMQICITNKEQAGYSKSSSKESSHPKSPPGVQIQRSTEFLAKYESSQDRSADKKQIQIVD